MNGNLYLSFVVFFQMIVVTLQLLLPLLGLASVEQAATYRVLITLLTYLPGIIIVIQRNFTMLMVSFVTYFVLLLFSYELFPESHRFIEGSQAYTLTPISILTAIFVASIKDMSQFTKMLLIISRASVIIALLYVVAYNISPLRDMDDTYSMSFGYSMLLPAMYLFSQKRLIDKIASLVFLVLIFLGGSRGPAFILVAFYFVDLFLFNKAKEWIKIVPYIVAVSVAAFILLPRYIDLESSRTYSLLESGEVFTHDSGRKEDVYGVIRPHIWERPVTGWGIGADRYFLDGSYSHTLFLEMYLHYGIFIGTFIMATFFIWCIRLYNSKRIETMENGRKMFIMMFMYGFLPLLVSGSYLIDFSFAIMIGVFLHIKRVVLLRK